MPKGIVVKGAGYRSRPQGYKPPVFKRGAARPDDKRQKHSGRSELKVGLSCKPTLAVDEDEWAADEYQWKGDAFRFADKGMEDEDLVAQIQDDALRMGRELHVESCVLV